MKMNEIEKMERELRRAQKKQESLARKQQKKKGNVVGEYIKRLASLFFYDEEMIYNIPNNPDIFACIEEMKQELPREEWETVIRKAVKSTGVKEKEIAYTQLKTYLES
ncbi:LB_289 family protein [Spirochaeta thermophila]|uniref:Uncharacterized protein n=2 Tax=Winmispira thermophila TaxID=154 RepID=G0GG36_WINT7|nr:hypothetical protein [Spirochaeta thermophila]ADN03139.1 hypothetical protein STHERM_c22120 [Spirochaeta thermophila DSM 6192]AEJ62512.1 hypothetical protein Spith_2257 [Spirochaeta thermophila DSM 6578]